MNWDLKLIRSNPYLEIVYQNLPRLLALYQDDSSHPLYGCGDRRFWGWKLIDFPNGTYQSAAFGLAYLYKKDLLPNFLSRESCLERIIAMITVLPSVIDRKGGLAEALPNEGSFCVTGLVLADVLGAIELLQEEIEGEEIQKLLEICAPMAKFLKKQDETHGIISNHLATCALGMIRWHEATGDNEAYARAELWIERIKENSNAEGWMSEYGTADPGYQSWCLSSLVQITTITDKFELQHLIESGYNFLESFAMPDGSFSNGCGGRMTRFLFPGGAEMCSDKLGQFAQSYILKNTFVNLNSIDEPNLAPFFNDTVLAAIHFRERENSLQLNNETRYYKDAGLLVHHNNGDVTTVNVRRGGWILRISPQNHLRKLEHEPAAYDHKERLLCSKNGRVLSFKNNKLIIESELHPVQRMLPSALKFIVLRIISLTIFHSLYGGNLIKRMLAGILLKTNGQPTGFIKRTIDLETGVIDDRIKNTQITSLKNTKGFSPMHMASQGYWQVFDDTTP